MVLGASICSATTSEQPLSFRLFSSILQEHEGNVVFSPAGVEAILTSLKKYSAGQTLDELNALNIPGAKTHFNISVQQADGLFVSEKLALTPTVTDAVKINFENSAHAADTINTWCTERTNGLINQLVQASDFSLLTAFVATNAIYMKSDWLYPFRENESFTGSFTTADGKKSSVKMMSNTAKYPVARGKDWVAIALPYKATQNTGEHCYFVAICPMGDARKFATTLTGEKYSNILTTLSRESARVQLIMPRFTLEGDTLKLNDALKAAGLTKIFTRADFSGLLAEPRDDIFLKAVLQKCYVKVDETGTEAAAATAAIAQFRSMPRTISLNRPFIWMITDLSGNSTPLFMGIYEQP